MKEPARLVPAIYSWNLAVVQKAANVCGYAIAVHGSMSRDFDLVAVPWVEDATSADDLVMCICASMELTVQSGDPVDKPHGRLSYTLKMDGDRFIDLCVMRRHSDGQT